MNFVLHHRISRLASGLILPNPALLEGRDSDTRAMKRPDGVCRVVLGVLVGEEGIRLEVKAYGGEGEVRRRF